MLKLRRQFESQCFWWQQLSKRRLTIKKLDFPLINSFEYKNESQLEIHPQLEAIK